MPKRKGNKSKHARRPSGPHAPSSTTSSQHIATLGSRSSSVLLDDHDASSRGGELPIDFDPDSVDQKLHASSTQHSQSTLTAVAESTATNVGVETTSPRCPHLAKALRAAKLAKATPTKLSRRHKGCKTCQTTAGGHDASTSSSSNIANLYLCLTCADLYCIDNNNSDALGEQTGTNSVVSKIAEKSEYHHDIAPASIAAPADNKDTPPNINENDTNVHCSDQTEKAITHQNGGTNPFSRHAKEHASRAEHPTFMSVIDRKIVCFECMDFVDTSNAARKEKDLIALQDIVQDAIHPGTRKKIATIITQKQSSASSSRRTSISDDSNAVFADDLNATANSSKRSSFSSDTLKLTDKIASLLDGKNRVGKQAKCAGLQNLGNTCFFNSLTQCLTYNINFVIPPEGPISKALLKFLCSMNVKYLNGGGVYDPSNLFTAISNRYKVYKRMMQQDAHELLMRLFDEVDNEERKAKGLPAGAKTILQRQYGWKLWSIVVCARCKNISFTEEEYTSISLPIPGSTVIDTNAALSTDIKSYFDPLHPRPYNASLLESDQVDHPLSKRTARQARKEARSGKKKSNIIQMITPIFTSGKGKPPTAPTSSSMQSEHSAVSDEASVGKPSPLPGDTNNMPSMTVNDQQPTPSVMDESVSPTASGTIIPATNTSLTGNSLMTGKKSQEGNPESPIEPIATDSGASSLLTATITATTSSATTTTTANTIGSGNSPSNGASGGQSTIAHNAPTSERAESETRQLSPGSAVNIQLETSSISSSGGTSLKRHLPRSSSGIFESILDTEERRLTISHILRDLGEQYAIQQRLLKKGGDTNSSTGNLPEGVKLEQCLAAYLDVEAIDNGRESYNCGMCWKLTHMPEKVKSYQIPPSSTSISPSFTWTRASPHDSATELTSARSASPNAVIPSQETGLPLNKVLTSATATNINRGRQPSSSFVDGVTKSSKSSQSPLRGRPVVDKYLGSDVEPLERATKEIADSLKSPVPKISVEDPIDTGSASSNKLDATAASVSNEVGITVEQSAGQYECDTDDLATDSEDDVLPFDEDRPRIFTKAYKRYLIQPSVASHLIIHLKRFQNTGGLMGDYGRRSRKLDTPVAFSKCLCINNFWGPNVRQQACKKFNKETQSYERKIKYLPELRDYSRGRGVDSSASVYYALTGIVVHSGSLNGGHYTAYVRPNAMALTREQLLDGYVDNGMKTGSGGGLGGKFRFLKMGDRWLLDMFTDKSKGSNNNAPVGEKDNRNAPISTPIGPKSAGNPDVDVSKISSEGNIFNESNKISGQSSASISSRFSSLSPSISKSPHRKSGSVDANFLRLARQGQQSKGSLYGSSRQQSLSPNRSPNLPCQSPSRLSVYGTNDSENDGDTYVDATAIPSNSAASLNTGKSTNAGTGGLSPGLTPPPRRPSFGQKVKSFIQSLSGASDVSDSGAMLSSGNDSPVKESSGLNFLGIGKNSLRRSGKSSSNAAAELTTSISAPMLMPTTTQHVSAADRNGATILNIDSKILDEKVCMTVDGDDSDDNDDTTAVDDNMMLTATTNTAISSVMHSSSPSPRPNANRVKPPLSSLEISIDRGLLQKPSTRGTGKLEESMVKEEKSNHGLKKINKEKILSNNQNEIPHQLADVSAKLRELNSTAASIETSSKRYSQDATSLSYHEVADDEFDSDEDDDISPNPLGSSGGGLLGGMANKSDTELDQKLLSNSMDNNEPKGDKKKKKGQQPSKLKSSNTKVDNENALADSVDRTVASIAAATTSTNSPLANIEDKNATNKIVEDTWYFITDSSVRKTKWEEVQKAEAYLLFYCLRE